VFWLLLLVLVTFCDFLRERSQNFDLVLTLIKTTTINFNQRPNTSGSLSLQPSLCAISDHLLVIQQRLLHVRASAIFISTGGVRRLVLKRKASVGTISILVSGHAASTPKSWLGSIWELV
jgi:hypothetical protein